MLAKITQKTEVAAGTLEVQLATIEDFSFVPGQFFSLTLLNPPFTDDRGNRRILGFVNSPSQQKQIKFIIRTRPSAFKRSLLELDLGTKVEVAEIGGSMGLPEDSGTPITIITGGIGIAPFMSLLSVIKEKSLPHKITMIYANTYRVGAIYLNELEEFAKDNPNFKLISVLTGGKGLSEETLKNNLGSDKTKYLISGTPRFVPAIVKMLRKLGVLNEQMRFEIFTGY